MARYAREAMPVWNCFSEVSACNSRDGSNTGWERVANVPQNGDSLL
jgi:hypothetical protein